MKTALNLADIIDLEYFFAIDSHQQEQDGEKALHLRDRTIYLSRQQELQDVSDNRGLLCSWLAARKMHELNSNPEQPLPGSIWQESATLIRWLTLLLGLASGYLLASSLLHYDGVAPVNVSGYFSLFVLLQLGILAFILLLIPLRSLGSRGIRASLLCNLAAGLLKQLFLRLQRRYRQQSPGQIRLLLETTFAQLRLNRQEYGNLYFWPAFVLLQIFAVGFNLAILATTLLKISLSDIAFGWQSTLQINPAQLAVVIKQIALPWSWLLPARLAYPSLAQIEGSRIILKEGIYGLASSDLAAWWPFLCCGVLTYGLLPRLFLLGYGLRKSSRTLASLRFDSARFRQLRHRMLTPLLQTQALRAHPATPKVQPEQIEGEATSPTLSNSPLLEQGPKVLLIPDEIWEDLERTALEQLLTPHEGTGPFTLVRAGRLDQSEEELFIEVATALHENNATGLVLLQEGWQPPIRETLALLQRLRRDMPRRYPVSVVLIGKPAPDTPLTATRNADLKIWRKTLQTLADPYLAVFPLVSDS